jgi:superfamily I DNA/RNA helicase
MTLHSAKGLEYPVVFLVGVEEEFLPHRRSMREEDERSIEEERRLFYVGITRARRRLFLTSARERLTYGAPRPRLPSRFLTELGDTGLFERETYDPKARAQPEQSRGFLEQYWAVVRAKTTES